jgi:hypothetical protein
MTVEPIRPGVAVRDKNDMVDFVAQRIASFIEKHGIAPETLVIAMWADGEEFSWGTGMISPGKSVAAPIAHGTAIALLQRSL